MIKYGYSLIYIYIMYIYIDIFHSMQLKSHPPHHAPVDRRQFTDGSLYEGGWREDVPEDRDPRDP